MSFFHGFHDIDARFTNNYHCILLFIKPRRVLVLEPTLSYSVIP